MTKEKSFITLTPGERAQVLEPVTDARAEDCPRRPFRLRQVHLRPAPAEVLQLAFRRDGKNYVPCLSVCLSLSLFLSLSFTHAHMYNLRNDN